MSRIHLDQVYRLGMFVEVVSAVDARDEAARIKDSGEEALCLACRDAVIKLRESLTEDFASKVRHLVSHTLRDREFFEREFEIVDDGAWLDLFEHYHPAAVRSGELSLIAVAAAAEAPGFFPPAVAW